VPMRFNQAGGLLVAFALLVPPGCAAIRSLDSAAASLDTYELQPADVPSGPRTFHSITVDMPASPAAVGTDRILVKPDPLTVAYLPGARWIEPAPAHIQSLMVRSLANSGRTGLVGASAAGMLPDYVLMSRIDAFQAEVAGPDQPVRVVVGMTLSIMSDIDGRIVATRRFGRTVNVPSDAAPAVVSAFNVAMSDILARATDWAIASIAGRAV
jgi:cholesterol transport system auxiliary component